MGVDIEQLAANTVSDRINYCPRLEAFITTNDKTPVYDGEILVYRDSTNTTKENLGGRVRVQVKGTTTVKPKGRKRTSYLSYSVSRADLESFQRDGGGLYFVVTIGKNDPRRRKPYFTVLQPFRIAELLETIPATQMSLALRFDLLPAASARVQGIVGVALRAQRQDMELNFNITKRPRIESLTIFTYNDVNFDEPVQLDLSSGSYVLEARTTDGLSLPVAAGITVTPPEYQWHPVEVSISSGGVFYEGADMRRVSSCAVELDLSEALRITHTLTSDEGRVKVDIQPTGNLAALLKAMEFYVALVESGALISNGVSRPFRVPGEVITEEFTERLSGLRRLSELCEHLHVDPHLVDCDEITDHQYEQLGYLQRYFIDGKELKDTARDEPVQWLLAVGRWHIKLLVTEGSGPGLWRLVDPFAAETRHHILWRGADDEPSVPVTAYELINEDGRIGTVLNSNLAEMRSAYESIVDSNWTSGLATESVMSLILAADTVPERREKLLDAAEHLSRWLLDVTPAEPAHLINLYQIAHRRGSLTEEQKVAIRQLRQSTAGDLAQEARISCGILLGEHEEANYLLDQLSETSRQRFRRWPIWKLHPASGDGPDTVDSTGHSAM